MNVQEVATRVRRIFGDESGVQVTDADIIRWINDAQEEIVLNNPGLMEATAQANAVISQAEYDVPSDMSVLRSLKFDGYRVKPMSFAEFNEYIDGYANASAAFGLGIPEVFMVWNSKITLFPTPNKSIDNGLTIYYIQHPTPVATMADTLNVPLQYHNAVVDYCLRQSYELDEDYQKAQLKEAQFDKTMTKLNDRNKWTAQEYYPRITVLPDDADYGDYGYLGGTY